jgi:hypothetical protein
VSVPDGTTKVLVDGPGLPEREMAARDGVAILPPLDRAGLYHVRWNDPHVGSALIAANLTSARESDVRARPVPIAGAPTSTTTNAAHVLDAHSEWVIWLALLAALAFTADVYWTTRQPRGRRVGALR